MMPSFQSLFVESKGQPVEYKGQVIQMVDRVPVADGQKIRVVFESIDSDWKQGVHLSVDGSFEVNGQIMKKTVALWSHTAPREVLLKIKVKKGECLVKNVWDNGDGTMDSWHNGAAMIVEQHGSIRRYRCNDGKPDDDFSDIVFTLELLAS
jgi:hypothetical protein